MNTLHMVFTFTSVSPRQCQRGWEHALTFFGQTSEITYFTEPCVLVYLCRPTR